MIVGTSPAMQQLHLDAAAGAAGLAKAVLCLENGLVPPQPHFERPNPHIDFEAAPVRVAQMLEPLPPQERPWRCGVSSFGLSGVNTHVIVAEHQAEPLPQDDGHWQCVVFFAPDETSLQDYARAIAAAVARNEGWPLHAVAATLMTGRDALPVRAAFVARSRQELLEQLDAGVTGIAVGNAARHDSRDSMENPLPGAFFVSQEAAQAAASAYLAGASLAWPAERPVYRVHLPAAPLAAATLWPRFAAHFLSEPVMTPAGKAFALAVDRPDFWPAAEHRLEGTPLLVGMSLLDCLGWIGGAVPLSLHDLRWRKPVTCGPGCRAVLLAQEQGDALAVELHHFEPATRNSGEASTTGLSTGTWNVAASGLVRGGIARPAALNLATVRESLREIAQQDTPEDSPLMVSGRWQCRKALWGAEDGNTLLAELCLPEAYRADFNTFRWHPAMMDIAASLALRGAYGFVPAGCRIVRLHSPLTAQAFALVRITDRQQGMIVADCTVTDASGQIVAELEGMTFMALRKGQIAGKSGPDTPQMHPLHSEQPQPELYAIGWKQADLEGCVAGPQNIMLLGGQASLLGEALEPLAHARRPLPLQADEIRALAHEILAGPTDHLLWLPALEPGVQNDTWPLCALLQEICSGGLRRPLRVTVVGRGAFAPDAPAHEPHQESLPQGALYMGPLLCLPWEEPRISCAYVELEEQNAASVAALVSSLGLVDGPYVADCDGTVRVRELVKLPSAPASAATPAITKNGCVVITGGLGGMGQTLARQIHERHGAHVVLLHRSSQLPPHALEGVPFAAFRCDVTDAAQVEEVFAKIRSEVGPVQGVIHTAGVAGRGYLLTSDRQGYESVLAPKVAGAWNLHKATLGDDLAFFVLASSRTALVGAPGQSDYTAANAFLNAFARYRRRLGLPALSINWNTWSGVGMAVREGLGNGPEAATMLAPQQALAVLEAALASGEELVAVGMTGENAADFALNGLPRGELPGCMLGSASISGGAAQGNAPQAQPMGNADHFDGAALLEIIRDCLGYDRPLTREDDFFDLGGDSIAATRIVNRLDKEAGLALAVADLLESDTLGDIVDCALASCKPAQPLQKAEETTPVLDKYPVGNEQLAILYADMVSEGDLGFNLPAFLVMPPDADAARLERALAQLVERHEALRTSFCDFEAERPAMIIHPFTGFTLEERRIPDLAHKDDIIRPFNLRNETGFRASLLVTDAGEKVLFLDVHHALGDGRTMSLLNVELYRLYHGLELAPVTAQMKDIAWQQVTHPDAEAAAYWQNIYKGELPRLDLPASHPRPRVHTGRGGTYEFGLAPALVQAIKGLARREGLTNYQVSLCAWSLLAQAYTGSQDIVVAVSMDSRGEHLNTAGMLASVLPLRFSVDPCQPLSALLRATRQVSNEGMRHRAYILNSLLADLRQTAWPDRSPLSEIILSYMNFEFAAEGQGLFESLRFSKFSSKTDLSIFVSDIGESISIALEYYADLFSEADVLRMARDYVRILELMTSAPGDAPLGFTPTDLPCAAGRTVSLEQCEALAPAAVRQGIEAVATGKGASAEVMLLAVFAVLMGKVTQQEQFVVEVPPERAIRFSIDDNMEFEELLAFTQKGLTDKAGMGNADHGDSGLADDGMPLMQSALRLGFAFARGGVPTPDAQGNGYGLFCSVREQEEGLALYFAYDPQQVVAETARDWLTYYGNFLEGIIEGAA